MTTEPIIQVGDRVRLKVNGRKGRVVALYVKWDDRAGLECCPPSHLTLGGDPMSEFNRA